MRSHFILFLVLLIVFPLALVAGLSVGSISTDFSEVYHAIFKYDASNASDFIIIELRLPRLVLTMLTGAALALSGYLMQAMVNNPLADPYILGTASGASLGVNIASMGFISFAGTAILPSTLFAFIGALLISILALGISLENRQINSSKLLLGGVALSSLSMALTTLLIYLSPTESRLKKVVFWSMGSLEQASWEKIPLLAVVLVVIGCISHLFSRHLSVLLLGESRASGLGLHVTSLRIVLLCFAALATAAAVAVTGPVGFVGLMVPHLIRALWGVHGKFNVLYVLLIGGLFLLVCDILSRILLPNADLPIGIITSFLGIPFFVYLLLKRNYRFS